MEILEPQGSRFELALELFRDGASFTYDGVGFWLASDGALEVRVQTSWRPGNVTEQTAMGEFARAEKLANSLADASPAFASLVRGRPLCFVLVDEYKMGGITLCRLVDGQLSWPPGYPVAKGAT